MLILNACVACLSILGFQPSTSRPDAFARAEAERAKIQTARIEWYASIEGATDPEDANRFFTDRMAGPDYLTIDHGFADGRMFRTAEIGMPMSFSERRLLLKDAEQWQYTEDSLAGRIATTTSGFLPYRNLRDLGFEPSPLPSNERRWSSGAAESYEIEDAGGYVMVTGHFGEGWDIRWTLDPSVGMQPIRSATVSLGEEVDVCETNYSKTDGIWFPTSSVFTHRGEVTKRMAVLDAEFNRPAHPGELSGEDLGLVPGVALTHQELGATVWNGGRLIAETEWFETGQWERRDLSAYVTLRDQLLAGTGAGRFPRRLDEGLLGMGNEVVFEPGLWETYTRRFIQRFRLKPHQAERAWKTLKECQDLAYRYLNEHEKDIKAVRSESGAIDPQDMDEAALKRKEALEERLDKLNAPIDKIFNEQLKPGLAKLVSREQVEAAKRRDTELADAIRAAKPADGH